MEDTELVEDLTGVGVESVRAECDQNILYEILNSQKIKKNTI